jgi:transcriptional regulator with XRE-family HTH domain
MKNPRIKKYISEIFLDLRLSRLPQDANSIRDLSKKTGISKSTINYIEKGIVSPSLDTIIKLLNGLNISLKDFCKLLDKKISSSSD